MKYILLILLGMFGVWLGRRIAIMRFKDNEGGDNKKDKKPQN